MSGAVAVLLDDDRSVTFESLDEGLRIGFVTSVDDVVVETDSAVIPWAAFAIASVHLDEMIETAYAYDPIYLGA